MTLHVHHTASHSLAPFIHGSYKFMVICWQYCITCWSLDGAYFTNPTILSHAYDSSQPCLVLILNFNTFHDIKVFLEDVFDIWGEPE